MVGSRKKGEMEYGWKAAWPVVRNVLIGAWMLVFMWQMSAIRHELKTTKATIDQNAQRLGHITMSVERVASELSH